MYSFIPCLHYVQRLCVHDICLNLIHPILITGASRMSVPFVFSTSRFQGPAFGCDKIVVIVTLLEAIEGIPDKDCNFLGNDKFPNLYERLLHERKLKSRYLERRIYERPLKSEPFIENQSEHISKLFLHQSVVKLADLRKGRHAAETIHVRRWSCVMSCDITQDHLRTWFVSAAWRPFRRSASQPADQ